MGFFELNKHFETIKFCANFDVKILIIKYEPGRDALNQNQHSIITMLILSTTLIKINNMYKNHMDILSKTFLQCFDIFAQPVYKWGCYIRVQTYFSTHFQIWNLKSWQPINLKCFIDPHLTNLIIICVSWNTYLNPERGLIAYGLSPVWVIGKMQNDLKAISCTIWFFVISINETIKWISIKLLWN